MLDDKSFLSLFLTEEIYLLKGDIVQQETPPALPAEPKASKVAMPANVTQEPKVAYKGKNTKGILIITSDHNLSAQEETFLAKVLQAVKVELNETALMSQSNTNGVGVLELAHQTQSNIILAFGINDPTYKPYHISQTQGLKILMADPLKLIETDRDKKIQLWDALKKLFL
jgi:hypothetical protein